MKVAVCGNDIHEVTNVVSKLEKILNTEAVTPKIMSEHPIVEMAAETYGQTKRKNVVYVGCALTYLVNVDEKFFDVYEQIVLNSLLNLDKVFVVTNNMDENELSIYKYYGSLMGGKIVFVSNVNDVVL